jgi:hypothetical protein
MSGLRRQGGAPPTPTTDAATPRGPATMLAGRALFCPEHAACGPQLPIREKGGAALPRCLDGSAVRQIFGFPLCPKGLFRRLRLSHSLK